MLNVGSISLSVFRLDLRGPRRVCHSELKMANTHRAPAGGLLIRRSAMIACGMRRFSDSSANCQAGMRSPNKTRNQRCERMETKQQSHSPIASGP